MFQRFPSFPLVILLASSVHASTQPTLATDACKRSLHPAVQKLRALAGLNPFSWPSEIAVDGQLLTSARPAVPRARAAMRAVLTPGGTALPLFQKETGLGLDLQDARLWDLYMRSYDLLGFSDGYIELLFRASAALPDEGDVLDLGAGTGNFPAFFLHERPRLKATLIDKLGTGLELAKAKMEAFAYTPDRYRIIAGDITDETVYPKGPFSAVILNNVLYTLPREQKLAVLKHAMARVPSGTPVLIGEPLVQGTAKTIAFFDANLVSAIEQGAPFTDHSVFAMLAVNAMILQAKVPRHFTNPEELIPLMTSLGLKLDHWDYSYFDGAAFYVSRTP